MMIYMDGLNNKKKERLHKYLKDKLDSIVDYYVGLLKKKERQNLVLPELTQETTSLDLKNVLLDKLKKKEIEKSVVKLNQKM